LCDVYEPRIVEGRKVTGEQTPAYSDYRKLLEARDIDAVMVATPLALHAEHVIGALDSGRAVYGEKSMGPHARRLQSYPECRTAARERSCRSVCNTPMRRGIRKRRSAFRPEASAGYAGLLLLARNNKLAASAASGSGSGN